MTTLGEAVVVVYALKTHLQPHIHPSSGTGTWYVCSNPNSKKLNFVKCHKITKILIVVDLNN
ncbi:hypothetical protein Mapa_003552 [Marchantia paleacea]|nr:hypothetical protein Mapa_003552 [Marchantia paleacea]